MALEIQLAVAAVVGHLLWAETPTHPAPEMGAMEPLQPLAAPAQLTQAAAVAVVLRQMDWPLALAARAGAARDQRHLVVQPQMEPQILAAAVAVVQVPVEMAAQAALASSSSSTPYPYSLS